MKLNGNQNIIFDNDIIMTGNSIGKSLSSVMDETTNDIAKLKAYLAWAYNHGGLGGNGSGHGAGGSSNAFGANVWIDGVQVSSTGGSINIDNSVSTTHTLQVKITKGGSDTFVINGNYGSGNNKSTFSGNASLESNNLTQTFTLTKLVDNGSLYINITNASTEDTKEITYTYITNPYKFSFNFYNGDGTELVSAISDNDLSSLFMENYTSGICLAFNYDIIATTLDYGRCYIEYNDLSGKTHTLYFKDNELNITSTGKGTIPLKLDDDIKSFFASTDNAGTYGITVATHIFSLNSSKDEGEIIRYDLTIIPKSLFLKVATPSGQLNNANKSNSIENTETLIENEQQFSSTQFSLSLTPYDGLPNSAKTYDYGYTIYNLYNFVVASDTDTDVSKLYEQVSDKVIYSNTNNVYKYITTYKLTTDTTKQDGKTYYVATIPFVEVLSPNKDNIKLYYTYDNDTKQYNIADKFEDNVKYYVIKLETSSNLGYVEVQNENTTGKLADQTAKSITIIPGGTGIKFVTFYLKNENNIFYYVGYYLKTKRATTKFTWYPTDPISQNNPVTAYWRKGDSAKNIIINEALSSQEAASLNMASTLSRKFIKTKFTGNDGSKIKHHDVLLSLGIQYSKVNNTDRPICSFNVEGSDSSTIKAGSVIVYQNKLCILSADTTLDNNGFPVSVTSANSTDIFIPLIDTLDNSNFDNFHLLTVYFNNEFYSNTTNYSKSINCYIDGTLEGSLPTYINDIRLYSSVTFFPGLYYTNLLEITYLLHEHKNGMILTSLQDKDFDDRTYMTENDIKGYYYTYRALLADDSSNAFELWQLFNQFKYDDTNHVIYDGSENTLINENGFINNLIKNGVDCPIMVLECDNTNSMRATSGIGLQKENIDNILEWLDGSYAESNVSSDNKGADPATGSVVVTLYYTSNTTKDKKLKQITGPSGENVNFDLTLQGSSTKSYHGKNFELKAQQTSTSSGYITLFTPNWRLAEKSSDTDAYDTFLPEKEFTLKGDIVDSSHSTNDVIGKFVNKTTTKFSDAIDANTKNTESVKYIKNCLLGFPILLFFVSKYTDNTIKDSDNRTVENIYLLGIYNFNLGRASYNNLGYNKLDGIESLISEHKKDGKIDGTFQMFNVKDLDNSQLKGVEVAEIQENNRYFDFSQTQPSILFPKNDNDEGSMWGDFVTSNSDTVIQNHIQTMMRMVAKSGGDIFTILGKTMSEDGPQVSDDNTIMQDSITSAYGYGEKYSAEPTSTILNGIKIWNTSVPNYKHQVIRYNPGTSTEWYYSFVPVQENSKELSPDDFASNLDKTLIDMENTILNVAFPYNYIEGDEEKTNNPEIDIISLCEYYTICMAFGMVDSVQKNLNMKTWEAIETPDSTFKTKQTWYTAFYDMDTAFGINNAGTKIDFFAFSDYWDCQIQKNDNGLSTILAANIYRDYSPAMASNGEATYQYFDIPSNYLFAIAKYSHAILSQTDKTSAQYEYYNSLQNNYKQCNPATIWTKFRNSTTDASDPKKGQLQNIDYFIDNYFLGYTKNIPDEAWNFDYKYKYLVKTKIITNGEVTGYTYDNNNLGKFIGRKIYYTKYWLQNRIHLMDGYMNILGLYDVINTYKDPTGSTLTVYSDIPDNNVQIDTSNTDNYMTRDIFSTNNQAPKYPQNNSTIEVTAESRAISIIKFSTTSVKRVIFPQNPEPLKIPLDIAGNNQAWFFGSQQWTKINNINNVIADGGNLSLTSDSLNEISANNGTLSTGISMRCPAITNIELTSPTFNSLNFNIDGTTDTYYKNLATLNLSNTKTTTVKLQKINLAKLILNNMDKCNLSFNGLTNLNECQLSGSFSEFNIECWNNNNILSGINMDDSQTMIVSNPITSDNKFLYDNAEINLSNCGIYKTKLTGFSSINISNCDSIYYININNPEKIERLSIVLGDTWDSKSKDSDGNVISNKFTLLVNNTENSDEDVIDLHEFTNLKYLCLTGCKEKTIIFPNKVLTSETDKPITIELAPSCFEKNINWTNVIFENADGSVANNVTTQFIITGTNTFYNIQSGNAPLTAFFKNTDDASTVTSLLHVSKDCSSLRNTFNTLLKSAEHALQYKHCKAFLDQIVLDDETNHTNIGENIIDISNMFANNEITYDFNTFQTDYNDNTCSLNLMQFVNCINWENCLNGNNILYFNKYIYGGITKNDKQYGLGINNYSNSTSFEYKSLTNNTLYTTIDAFEYIMPYITKYNASDLFYFIDKNESFEVMGKDPTKPIKLNNIFCITAADGTTKHCKLTYINGFNVADTYSINSGDTIQNTPLYYDLSGMFDCTINDSNNYVWDNIHGGSKYKTLSLINTLNKNLHVNSTDTSYDALNTLFANCKLLTIYNSINIICDKNIDLYSIFNWGVNTLQEQTNVKKYEYNESVSTFQYCTQLFMDYDETNASSNYSLNKINRSGFVINKECTYDNFHKIIFGILSSPIKYASAIFSDCNILISSDEYGKKFTDGANNSLNIIDDEDALKYFTFCDDKQFADYNLDNKQISLKCINEMFMNLKLINDKTNENLPIKINHNFMEFFTQVESFVSAFAGWYVNNTIPFDIFRTRSKVSVTKSTESIYCDDKHTIQGTLYSVSSTPSYVSTKFKGKYVEKCFADWYMPVLTAPQMLNKNAQLYETFGKELNNIADKLWKGRYAFKINRDYNNDYTYTDNDVTKINAVTGNYVIGQNGKVYDYYYNDVSKSDGSDKIILTNDIFVQDAIDAEADNYSTYHYALHWIGQTSLYNNGCVDCSGCFVSPDLLQGFSPLSTVGWNTIISSTSTGVSFTGTIPKHLFKKFNNLIECLTFLKGYNITPIYMGDKYQYVKESHDTGNFEVGENKFRMKYYKYIPDNLYSIELQNFTIGSFGFNIILPHYDLDEKYIEYFFVIDRNSISHTVTSLENPWPNYNVSTTYLGTTGDSSSYSMLTTLWQTTTKGENITSLKDIRANQNNANNNTPDLLYTDSYIRYNICGNFVEENDKTTVTAGLDISYFNNLKLDNLIYSPDILPIMSGYLFANIPSDTISGFTAEVAANRFNTQGSTVISLQENPMIPLIISYEMNLPLVASNEHLIGMNTLNLTVNKHSLSESFINKFNTVIDWNISTDVDKNLKTLQIVPNS